MAPFLFLFMPRNRKRRCWPDHNDDNAMIEKCSTVDCWQYSVLVR